MMGVTQHWSNYNRFIINNASEQLLSSSMLVLYCLILLKKLENWITDLKSAEQFETTKLYSNRLDVKMHFWLTPLKLHDIPFLDITSNYPHQKNSGIQWNQSKFTFINTENVSHVKSIELWERKKKKKKKWWAMSFFGWWLCSVFSTVRRNLKTVSLTASWSWRLDILQLSNVSSGLCICITSRYREFKLKS